MASKAIATTQSTTTHAGSWQAGSDSTKVRISPNPYILREGDMWICAISGHGTNPITVVSGNAVDKNGKKVARVDDIVTGCGAVINSGITKVQVSDG